MDSAWRVFVKEKSQEQGKSEEEFEREFAYQVEMHCEVKKGEFDSITKEQLVIMWEDYTSMHDLDHQESEADRPSELIWGWWKEAGLPRKGGIGD